jgi:K+-sensing histidine kinase KdpD
MGINDEKESTPIPPPVEMVVRTLRHEVGDLLQSVYSAVAILQERLPRDQSLERTILADLRGRAETCKHELDATHDIVCPFSLNRDRLDLAQLVHSIAATFAQRNPGVGLQCHAPHSVFVLGDAQRLNQVGILLLISLAPSSQSPVEMRVGKMASTGMAEWAFLEHGLAATTEQLSWLTRPFSTTRQARFGLALALARRVIELHGGWVRANDNPEKGFQLTLELPLSHPATEG